MTSHHVCCTCLQALEDAGVMPHVRRFAGSSAGAMTSLLNHDVTPCLLHVLAGSGGRWCDAARASLRWLQRWRHVHRGAGGGLQRAGRRQVLLRRLEGNLPRYTPYYDAYSCYLGMIMYTHTCTCHRLR